MKQELEQKILREVQDRANDILDGWSFLDEDSLFELIVNTVWEYRYDLDCSPDDAADTIADEFAQNYYFRALSKDEKDLLELSIPYARQIETLREISEAEADAQRKVHTRVH